MATLRSRSASSSCGGTYHVFLSFRVEEIGKIFADHLYSALDQAGFRTFRSDDDLKIGENINSQLEKAIQESKISIIVFSAGYASSIRCLDELVMILERKRTCPAHQVLPVFYHVDPSDVRNQMGSFEEAFTRHQESEVKGRVEGWKAALKEAADLAGMDLQNQANGHESKFIQNIIELVGDKLSCRTLDFALHLVGLDSRAQSINMWLEDESVDIGILAICGMSGIGKTTIAEYVYYSNFSRFDGCSFLANISEASKQHNGLISLQKQLLSNILRGRNERISSVHEGAMKIKDALQCKRILLVLDDVNAQDQIEAILGICDWLYTGSKIIITAKDEHLVKRYKVCKVHKLELLNFDESLELFSWHTFGQSHPNEQYMEIAYKVVAHCSGLPLAIKVLGSAFSENSMDVWESQLKKLETIPNKEICEKLKISYDSLDDHDKDVFLYVACFFVGSEEDYVLQILDGCGFQTKAGLIKLIQRCLLTTHEFPDGYATDFASDFHRVRKWLGMHPLLQEMGREIVHWESPKEPGKRSRIWKNKDSLHILKEKTGTAQIEGLICNMHESAVTACGGDRKHRFRENFDRSFGSNLGNLLKQRAVSESSQHFVGTTSRSSNDEALETKAFEDMRNLKLLQLNYVHISGNYKKFPKGLKWLCWRGFPLQAIPSDFLLEELVFLEMAESSLKNVWNGTKHLKCLKILDLSGSTSLIKTPNFLLVTNLERLILKNCISLIEVHESIGFLESLELLNLQNCRSLGQLPRSIDGLKSLKTLNLNGCSKLVADGIRNFKAQTWFARIGYLKTTKSLEISQASFPQFLVRLSLASCGLSDEAFPLDLSNFISLQELDLSCNPIHIIPDCIKGLPKLCSLDLSYCKSLRSITSLRESADKKISGCESWKMVCIQSFPSHNIDVKAYGCTSLDEIEGIFKLEPLRNMDPKIISNLGLSNFAFVGETNVPLQLPCADSYGRKISSSSVCHHPYFYYSHLTGNKFPSPSCMYRKTFQESCTFTTYIWGGKVPDWFNFKNRGHSISFVVPPNLDLRIQGLTLCFVYVWLFSFRRYPLMPPELRVDINNKTKGIKWRFDAWAIGYRDTDEDEDITMLNYWKLEDNDLKAGDELDVSVDTHRDIIAREIGVWLLYEDKEQEGKGKKPASEEEEVAEQICTRGKICDTDIADSAAKLCFSIHLDNPKLKLTSHRSPISSYRKLGYSGIIRDEKGMWMVGYCGCDVWYKYEDCNFISNNVYSTLLSISKGLRIICQRGWTGVEVELEVDSEHFQNLLRGEFSKWDPRLIDDADAYDMMVECETISYLLKICRCTLRQTPFNEWNQVADQLAIMALDQEAYFVVLEDPPKALELDCLSKQGAEIGEGTQDEHAQLSSKSQDSLEASTSRATGEGPSTTTTTEEESSAESVGCKSCFFWLLVGWLCRERCFLKKHFLL